MPEFKFVEKSSHERLHEIYEALVANGAHGLVKVCTTTYWFERSPKKGFFTAACHLSVGSIANLKAAAEAAGFVVRETDENTYSVAITFDVPEGDQNV